MRTTWRVLVALVALLALVATACGDDDSDTDTADTDDSSDTSADTSDTSDDTSDTSGPPSDFETVADGTLTVCSDIPYSPFEFEEEEGSGEYTGFDVNLVDAVALELDLDTEWRVTVFDTILASLAAGDCDIVASAMTITDERAEQANFSQPYYNSQQSLMVRTADAETYASLEDLAGGTIGVQTGTTGADYAAENLPEGATIREYEGGEQLFVALQAEEIDAVLQDLPVNSYRAAQGEEFVVTSSFGTEEQYGFAFSLDNEALLEAFDGVLTTFLEDGTYDGIYEEWFGDAPGSINAS
jgi:polar amino acid transport system substrate-binding protein